MRLLGSLLFLNLALSATAEVPGDWPRWRGPFDTGVARGQAPTTWNDTTNIAWKLEVPGKGHSSPVIWGDTLFLTTAIPTQPAAAPPAPSPRNFGQGATTPQPEHKLTVLAYHRRTGKLLWQHSPRTVKPHEGYHQRYGSFASNSPVTDGKRLYTFFGSHGAYAYSLEGKLLWQWDPGIQMRMRMAFGEGTAAVLDSDTLLLNFDHEGESMLFALDSTTGNVRWKVPRQEQSNWAPPLVITHNGLRQAILPAPNKTRSYDMRDGSVLWECAGLGANTIPAPVVFNNSVIVMSGFRSPNLQAIQLGRKGDLSGTDAVLWSTTKGTSYTPSPVLHQGKLYFITDSGLLSNLDAATGKPFYERVRLPKPYNFKASPIAVDNKLYLSTEEGDVVIVKMGETFEVLATNSLANQSFIATPAVSGGDLYLRSETHLFCVRQSAP
jgi:outer membrane protein assembly factor BamB